MRFYVLLCVVTFMTAVVTSQEYNENNGYDGLEMFETDDVSSTNVTPGDPTAPVDNTMSPQTTLANDNQTTIDNDNQTIIDPQTTQSATTIAPSTTTVRRTPSDDLTQTDEIIIGVTCGIAGLVIIGAIVYACAKRQQMQRERDSMYKKYLTSATDADMGTDNAAYQNEVM